MPWLQIKLTAARSEAEAVADALERAGALSVTIEDAGDEPRLQAALEHLPLWSDNRVTGLFPHDTDTRALVAALGETLGGHVPPHRIELLQDADWGRAWMENYRPLQIAPRLWIVPSWCTPPDPDAINIALDPGLAFGTGTHPTTALCLAWLAAQPLAGCTVIDYGCGSGILAIAALKLGAASAIGVDVDPQALAASRDNAARNGVADRYRSVIPNELETHTTGDVVVANILAGTLIDLASEIASRVKPGGRLALSGVLTEQCADVERAYAPYLALAREEREGWALLAGERRG